MDSKQSKSSENLQRSQPAALTRGGLNSGKLNATGGQSLHSLDAEINRG